MASLNQISFESGLIFNLEANKLLLYSSDIVLLCPCLVLHISILCFWHFFPLSQYDLLHP